MLASHKIAMDLLAGCDEQLVSVGVVLDDDESVAGHGDESLHLLVG